LGLTSNMERAKVRSMAVVTKKDLCWVIGDWIRQLAWRA
jgi:hypothetical protein